MDAPSSSPTCTGCSMARQPTLSGLPTDCLWEIGLYAATSYRTVGAMLRTSRALYEACNEEFLWREVARCTLDPALFANIDAEHARRLAMGRAQAAAWFAAQKRLGAVDDGAVFIVGSGGWTDMSYLVPGYFKAAVRSFALRSVSLALQKFLSAAMASTATQVLSQVKGSEVELRSYFSRVRDIAFPMHCIGQQGACVLATSLELCANPCQLTTIDLTRQLIRDQGAEALLAALIASRHTLRSLEKLILAENKLTDAVARTVGVFLEHATSRCGGLKVLDVGGNPNLSEDVLICASMGLRRSLTGCAEAAGTTTGDAEDWFTHRLIDVEYLHSIRSVRLHTLVLDRTGAGQQRGPDGRYKAGTRQTAAGAAALKTLLQCMTLLLASSRQCGAVPVPTLRTLPSSLVHRQFTLSMCECGLDKTVAAAAVKDVVHAYDANAGASCDGTHRFVLQLDCPVLLDDAWLQANRMQSEHVDTCASAHAITDGGGTANVPPSFRLLLLGRCLTWGIAYPVDADVQSKKKEPKGSCCAM